MLVQTSEFDCCEQPESFFFSDQRSPAPHISIVELSLACGVANPFIRIVDQLPQKPTRTRLAPKSYGLSDAQKKQASELYEQLIRTGTSRDAALELLGPLATEITKYKRAFSVSELKWTVDYLISENLINDRPFMSPDGR